MKVYTIEEANMCSISGSLMTLKNFTQEYVVAEELQKGQKIDYLAGNINLGPLVCKGKFQPVSNSSEFKKIIKRTVSVWWGKHSDPDEELWATFEFQTSGHFLKLTSWKLADIYGKTVEKNQLPKKKLDEIVQTVFTEIRDIANEHGLGLKLA